MKSRYNLLERFFIQLEFRLDMILYRGLLVFSLPFIHQLILHKKVLVNNKIIIFRNYFVNKFKIVTFNFFNKEFFYNLYFYIKIKLLSKNRYHIIFKYPSYLEVSYKTLAIIIHRDLKFYEIPFYSKINKKLILKNQN